MQKLSDEYWQAILTNNANYNHLFYYGVVTTGIFCRPSCKSKAPKKENVLIFEHTGHAIAANFRPCKRCKPTGEKLPDTEWIELVTAYINENYQKNLSLITLAEAVKGSPYHLHRTFKKETNQTPTQYIQQIRITKTKQLLTETNLDIETIGSLVGLKNTTYLITLFKKSTGETPLQYRKRRRNNDR